MVEVVSGSTPPIRAPSSTNRRAPPAPISSLARLHLLDLPDDCLEPLISPVLLPPGVICIDDIDDGNLVYGPDIVAYLRQREVDFQKSVIKGSLSSSISR